MNIFLIQLGKLISAITKLLRLGSGATWPGHIILKINPKFLDQMEAKLKHGSIVISGTNGKTTTALLITSILKKAGHKVLHNASGANLLNGIASSFIANAKINGQPQADIGVFEIDEANLPHALKHFQPETVVLLNLSRDQLDRYGEVEIMLEKWTASLKKLPTKTKLIINQEDYRLNKLAKNFPENTTFFNLQTEVDWPRPLLGEYNWLNTLAAIQVAKQLDISADIITQTLKEFKPAFGRGEQFLFHDRTIKMFLAKNPASFNANLTMLNRDLAKARAILFVLNDNIPDGRDVSWIYDIDSETLAQFCANKKIFVSGQRHYDMALRLKYAGVNIKEAWCSADNEKMINTMIQQTNSQELCLILPTYSAMLQSRKILIGREIL